jgi:hypothetical protein
MPNENPKRLKLRCGKEERSWVSCDRVDGNFCVGKVANRPISKGIKHADPTKVHKHVIDVDVSDHCSSSDCVISCNRISK